MPEGALSGDPIAHVERVMTMRRKVVQMIWTVILTTTLFAAGRGAPEESAKPGTQTTCVRWTTEARYSGFGYNHLVHLENQCDQVIKCHVSTDVNQGGVDETLNAKEKKTVLTMRGSPAREFKAQVSCKQKK